MDPTVNKSERYIPIAKPCLDESATLALSRCISDNWISGGPQVRKFEDDFAWFHGVKHGVAVASGTLAIELALRVLGVKPGDKVVVPTLTMVAVPNCVLAVGATPVFVDSEPLTGNPDAAKWPDERIKAAIVPHLYGVPASDFCRVAWDHCGDNLIEDCAEAHFARHSDGRPVGSVGGMGCFSFYSNKIITTGEGGMVVTRDPGYAAKAATMRAHSFSEGNHYHHTGHAMGCRMTDMQAAVGLSQLAQHAWFLRDRAVSAEYYASRLGDRWQTLSRTKDSAWWVYPVLCKSEHHRDRVRLALANAGIETRTFFHPMHLQPHLVQYAVGEYPVAEDLGRRGLLLPFYTAMGREDIDHVCNVLRTL